MLTGFLSHPGRITCDFKSVTPYLQTQVNLITSDRVLGVAIASPEVINLSTITESDDAESRPS